MFITHFWGIPISIFSFDFAKKKGALRGGLKHLSFYKVPYRVGWHAMGVVCKTVTPSQLMTNNTTPPEYMCIYTCINIYIYIYIATVIFRHITS